jgi:hypothetical protein
MIITTSLQKYPFSANCPFGSAVACNTDRASYAQRTELRLPTIPPAERAGLDRLATFTKPQIDELCTVLSAAPVVLDRDLFIKRLQPVSGVSEEDLEKISWSLMFLHSYLAVTSDISIDEFVADVCASISGSGIELSKIEDIRGVLPPLLEINVLRLRAKAVDLQVDHANVLQSTRVLTDVRPVFGVKSTDDIQGMLVFHTLKISYFEDEGAKEIYLVLDDRDLAELKESLERAKHKATGIRKLLNTKAQLVDFADTANPQIK